ncbi:MAG: cation diffusion facilitator family transporter [Candidatus Thermoplasmatota archaeon]
MNSRNHGNVGAAAATRPLLIAIMVTSSFTVIEFIGGILTDSLALMSDAGHMFTDTLALALSLGAMRVAMRPSSEEMTFGFLRAEILAALVNGATLILVSLLIFSEALERILEPPEIEAPLMLLVAVLGLAANAAGIYLLHDKSKGSLNVRGAFLHMLGDLLSSIAVIVGALLIMLFDLRIADPLLGILIGAIILYGSWKLVTQSTAILLESVPSHLKLGDIRMSLQSVGGVVEIHDLHVWTLTSGLHAMSAHVVVEDRRISDCAGIVQECERLLKERFSISHTTFQLEFKTCGENACVFVSTRPLH